MRKVFLTISAMVLAFGNSRYLKAETSTPTIVGRGTCGANCTYTLDSAGTFTLYGEGDMTDYKWTKYGDRVRWNDGNDVSPGTKYGRAIKSIVFAEGSNITSIGSGAFIYSDVSSGITIPDSVTKIGSYSLQISGLTELTIPESVTSIGNHAFWSAQNLTSVNIPEGVTEMGWGVFRNTPKLSEIIIPDSVDTSRWNANVFFEMSPDTEIICQGDEEKCKQKLAKYIPTDKGGTCTNYCINKEIKPAQSSQCTGSYIYENGSCHKRNEKQCNDTDSYYFNGLTCVYRPLNGKINCVNPSYKANYGYCNRIRYTLPEANEATSHDNENMIEWIFE